MKRKTGFFFDERCFWHSTGLHAVTLPVGGWVQPPAGGGHAESPETKRRMKNLMDVSGLTPQLALRSAAPASLSDLRRIHPDSYLERFKAISDNGGGMLGKVTRLSEQYLHVEVASGVEVQVQRGGVAQVLPKGTIK